MNDFSNAIIPLGMNAYAGWPPTPLARTIRYPNSGYGGQNYNPWYSGFDPLGAQMALQGGIPGPLSSQDWHQMIRSPANFRLNQGLSLGHRGGRSYMRGRGRARLNPALDMNQNPWTIDPRCVTAMQRVGRTPQNYGIIQPGFDPLGSWGGAPYPRVFEENGKYYEITQRGELFEWNPYVGIWFQV